MKAAPSANVPSVTIQMVASHWPVAVLLWLGALDIYGLDGKPQKKVARRNVQNQALMLNAGSLISHEWPRAFSDLLERLRQSGLPETEAVLFNTAWPSLMRRLKLIREAEWRERIRDETCACARAVRNNQPPVIGRNLPGRETLQQMATRLNMSGSTLANQLDAATTLPVRLTMNGRKRRVVDETTIQQVMLVKSDRTSLRASSRILGLSPKRVVQLEKCELLTTQNKIYSRANLMQFRDRVFGRVIARLDNDGARDWVSLAKVLCLMIPLPRTGNFFRAVLNSDLILRRAIEQASPSGLINQLLVSQSAVRDWLRHAYEGQEQELFSLKQAAKLLQLKEEVVCTLVRNGYLRFVVQRIGKRAARFVTPLELQHFNEQFVPLAVLARDAGISPKQAPAWAYGKQIELIAGPTIDGCRQYIARRNKITATPPDQLVL